MAHSHSSHNRCVRFSPAVTGRTCNTRYRAACYALPGRDFHPLDRASFAWRTRCYRNPNYAGQAAQILRDPALASNPFFSEVPHWGIYPLVALATVATIIASQAIITGAYSLTRQAMQLGWMPGLMIRQTSDEEYGQIYVPLVNWVMMVSTIAITIGFGSSARLAGAFGTAVSTTMLLTTLLLYDVMRHRWHWGLLRSTSIVGLFLVIDLAFFAANLLKILDGGYVPLLFGLCLFLIMITWHRGIAASP